MIVWGSSSLNIKAKNLGAACRACESGSVSLSAVQQVFTLYWIPLIPLKKIKQVVCQSCSTTYPVELYAEYLGPRETKFKTPWYSFSGLIIIALVFSMLYLSVLNSEKRIQAFKDNPTVDSYFIFENLEDENKAKPYAFAKILKVTDGKIKVYYSTYSYSNEDMAYKEAKLAKSSNEESALKYKVYELDKLDLKRIAISNFIT